MAYSPDGTTLWLFTSLSSGSSQIVTATSRLETILKANRIEFKALDVATDDKARSLWGRRAGKRKLPGLVRDGMVLGDINEVEEWNEYGEIKEMLALEGEEPAAPTTAPIPTMQQAAATQKPADIATPSSKETDAEPAEKSQSPSSAMSPLAASLQQIGFEAAEKAKGLKTKLKPSSTTESKERSQPSEAKTEVKEDLSKLDNSTLPGTAPPVGAADGATAQAPPTEPEKSPEPKSDIVRESEEAVESTTKLSVQSTDSLQPGSIAATGHRGSNLSAASAEEIAEVEEANKIEEKPEEEEKVAEAEPPELSPPERQVSHGAEKQDLLQEDLDDAGSNVSAEERRDGEPRVKFIGEAPGEEIDRVKATLGGKSVTESMEDHATAMKAAAEQVASEGERSGEKAESKESKDVEATADTKAVDETSKGEVEGKEAEAKPSSPKPAADPVAASDQGTDSTGAKTQDQAAADQTKAGDSVAE